MTVNNTNDNESLVWKINSDNQRKENINLNINMLRLEREEKEKFLYEMEESLKNLAKKKNENNSGSMNDVKNKIDTKKIVKVRVGKKNKRNQDKKTNSNDRDDDDDDDLSDTI
jgi:hypothetical protein